MCNKFDDAVLFLYYFSELKLSFKSNAVISVFVPED